GGFVQDDWTVTDRVALNLGLRYDKTLGDVPPAEQYNGSLQPTGRTFPGIGNVITFDDVSPRLGVVVKLDQDGKAGGKSSWGRYYGRLTKAMYWQIAPGNTATLSFYYNPATRQYDIPGGEYFNPKSGFGIDPNLKNQYTDQAFVGLERQILPDFGLTV